MITLFDWGVCLFFACIAVICFYQAYINLVQKRFTHFGFDAFMISINLRLAGRKRRKYVLAHMNEPERINQQGVAALFVAIVFVYALLRFWFLVIQPNLRSN